MGIVVFCVRKDEEGKNKDSRAESYGDEFDPKRHAVD
jgi:hypothetical protein